MGKHLCLWKSGFRRVGLEREREIKKSLAVFKDPYSKTLSLVFSLLLCMCVCVCVLIFYFGFRPTFSGPQQSLLVCSGNHMGCCRWNPGWLSARQVRHAWVHDSEKLGSTDLSSRRTVRRTVNFRNKWSAGTTWWLPLGASEKWTSYAM